MLKMVEGMNLSEQKTSQKSPESTTSDSKQLSLDASLSENVITVLTTNANTIKAVCGELAAIIEDQVNSPNPQTGGEHGDVVSQRLLEWTADLFAIAEDINYYVNPPASAK